VKFFAQQRKRISYVFKEGIFAGPFFGNIKTPDTARAKFGRPLEGGTWSGSPSKLTDTSLTDNLLPMK